MDNHLLTIQDVCDMLRLGKTFIYREIALGHLPAVKCGAATRISARALQNYIEALEAQGYQPSKRGRPRKKREPVSA